MSDQLLTIKNVYKNPTIEERKKLDTIDRMIVPVFTTNSITVDESVRGCALLIEVVKDKDYVYFYLNTKTWEKLRDCIDLNCKEHLAYND